MMSALPRHHGSQMALQAALRHARKARQEQAPHVQAAEGLHHGTAGQDCHRRGQYNINNIKYLKY